MGENDALSNVAHALRALAEEVRSSHETQARQIEELQRVLALVYDDVQELRAHTVEQFDRTGQRVRQVENVTSALTQYIAQPAPAGGE